MTSEVEYMINIPCGNLVSACNKTVNDEENYCNNLLGQMVSVYESG